MKTEDVLWEHAKGTVERLERAAEIGQREFDRGEITKAEMEAHRSRAKDARRRLVSYEPRAGNDYLCERCHLERGKHQALSQRPGDSVYDFWYCEECPAAYRIDRRA
jgi:hypothetical protein